MSPRAHQLSSKTQPPCFNCGAPAQIQPFLYCSKLCREEAKLVRYWRAIIRDGRIKRPDVAEALKIRVGIFLGGGYPERERRISGALREEIFQRDGYRCQTCGGEATQIDHINTGARFKNDINNPANLQAICDQCHREKTLSRFHQATPQEKHKGEELRLRAESLKPLRESDDQVGWQSVWHERAKERRAQFSGEVCKRCGGRLPHRKRVYCDPCLEKRKREREMR